MDGPVVPDHRWAGGSALRVDRRLQNALSQVVGEIFMDGT